MKKNEDLPVLEFENKEISKGDRIICIGHPDGHKYYASYGIITSDIKNITYTKFTENENPVSVVEHNAYLNQGNSGGVALNENMKIIGINVGGAYTITGHFSKGFMIPYNIVEENISKWKLKNTYESNKKVTNKELDEWKKENVKILVKEDSITKISAIINIEDKNETPKSWGMDFAIQRLGDNNVWVDMITKETMTWSEISIKPNENGITEMQLDWSKIYGELNAGTYRIVKYNGLSTLYSEAFKIK